jgi:hypothetical protein
MKDGAQVHDVVGVLEEAVLQTVDRFAATPRTSLGSAARVASVTRWPSFASSGVR